MNVVILSGRLVKDPEVRYTASQIAVCTFTLAVDRPFSRDRQSNAPTADFIRITVFGKQAENCEKYLIKGQSAIVQGRIQTGSYKNKDGQTVYTTDVIANAVEFGSKPAGSNLVRSEPAEEENWKPSEYEGYETVDEDEIPF